RPAHAGRLEGGHAGVDRPGRAHEMDEQGGAGPLAQPQTEVEIGRQAEVLQRQAVSGLARAMRGEHRVTRGGRGASGRATSAAAPAMKPSSATGTRRPAPARMTPTSPAISKPPTFASTPRPSVGPGG